VPARPQAARLQPRPGHVGRIRAWPTRAREALSVARSDLAAVADEVGVLDVDVQSSSCRPLPRIATTSAAIVHVRRRTARRRAAPGDLVGVAPRWSGPATSSRALGRCSTAPTRRAHRAVPVRSAPRPSVAEVPWSRPERRGRPGRHAAGAGLRGRRPAPGEATAPDVRSCHSGSADPYWTSGPLRALLLGTTTASAAPRAHGTAARYAARRCARGRAAASLI